MQINKWGILGLAGLMLVSYNLAQPGLLELRNNDVKLKDPLNGAPTNGREGYGPSLDWLDRLARSAKGEDNTRVKLNFSVLSSLMVAGLASGFRSQVANLLWMKSDEYWHEGLFTRQVPLMEAVVTLDPQFIDAWSTAGWHWAYNIYADIPSNPDYKAKGDLAIRKAQENAVETGIDYLNRGSAMNPDKYRLWFEYGWTRAEKGGYYDEKTADLYRMARKQSDARVIEITGPDNQPHKENNGLDILGRTIGHMYERVPLFHKSLDQYGSDLLALKPGTPDRKLLDENGRYWGLYGSEYSVIGDVYTKGDAVTKAQVKKLVPDVEEIIKAYAARQRIAAQVGRDQPVGAYVSITARYMPAQNLADKGDLQDAINTITGVMNVDPKYHLQRLATMAKIYELRGDAPAAIQTQLANLQVFEKTSSQDLGLHFLATLYQKAEAEAAKKGNTADEKKFARLAYETWYRSRSRDALDFYALRNTRLYEDKFGFTTPQNIVDEIKKSRKGGVPNAAPKDAPSIGSQYG
ncbi:hypothetical protein IAD21_02034 [Abditibacteriota bacterium]|nr:hypothetical protein IAD21_02034 [Abditibacteriota bacterium]